jgi:ubiquinone/menaquinone biosynthesis C-methylase UbiE
MASTEPAASQQPGGARDTLDRDDYEYRGLIASTWDVMRPNAGRWPDVAFYKKIILQSGQPALDVGCATGRLTLAYRAEGLDVDGVDVSPEMVEICRTKADEAGLAATFYQQGMETLDLPRRYRTIVVSSSTFQLLTDPAQAREGLRRFYEHLEPGGTLVMSLMLIYTGSDPGPTVREEWGEPQERTRQSDGAVVRRWSRSTYDLARQLESSEARYEVVVDGRVVASEEHSRSPATRWYTQEQSVALLREAGFTGVRLTSGFTHEPATPGDTLWCAIAVRPPA